MDDVQNHIDDRVVASTTCGCSIGVCTENWG
jgi:hypothetical protein